jgi:AraC-like DNA-binding protein
MTGEQSKLIVQNELNKLGLVYLNVGIGVVEILEAITDKQVALFGENLLASGLELQNDRKGMLIEKIKTVISEMIDFSEEQPKTNYSDYISDKLNYDYTYLSNLFSEVKGITIQHYIIVRKIERVKELMLCDDLNLTEISYKLHYSSVAHLSNQFKKVTGFTPSHYKQLRRNQSRLFQNVPESTHTLQSLNY